MITFESEQPRIRQPDETEMQQKQSLQVNPLLSPTFSREGSFTLSCSCHCALLTHRLTAPTQPLPSTQEMLLFTSLAAPHLTAPFLVASPRAVEHTAELISDPTAAW